MSFVVIATWVARPGEAEHVAEVLRALTPRYRAEPKMLSFHAHRSLTDRDTFVLVEHYSDPDGYDEHRATAAFREHVVKDLLPRLRDRQIGTYELLGRVL